MSRNGKFVAIGTAGGVQLLDPQNRKPLILIDQPTVSFDISYKTEEVATASGNKINIWPMNSKPAKSLMGFGKINDPSYLTIVNGINPILSQKAPSEMLLGSGSSSSLNLLNSLNGDLFSIAQFKYDSLLATSPDLKQFVVASRDDSSKLTLIVSNPDLQQKPAATPTVSNQSGDSGSTQENNTETSKILESPDAAFHTWQSISVSNTGIIAASFYGNDSSMVGLWSIDSGALLGSIPKKSDFVAISPDGNLLATVFIDEKYEHHLNIDDVSNPKNPRQVFTINQKDLLDEWVNISSLAFSPDGAWLAAGTAQAGLSYGNILLLRVADWQVKARLYGHVDSVVGLVFKPDGKTMYSSSKDGTIRVWGTSNRPDLLPTAIPTATPTVAPTPEPLAKPLSTVSQTDLVKLGSDNLNQLTELNRWQIGNRSKTGGCSNCAFVLWNMPTKNDQQVALIVFKDINEFHLLQPFSGDEVFQTTMQWKEVPDWTTLSPDGNTIAGISLKSSNIFLFSSTGILSKTLKGHLLTEGVGVAFTPDGHYLVSAATDAKINNLNEIIVWD
ncbi:MAG TPA: hypothetical protein VF338_12600, partial [Leptolinea sp.]